VGVAALAVGVGAGVFFAGGSGRGAAERGAPPGVDAAALAALEEEQRASRETIRRLEDRVASLDRSLADAQRESGRVRELVEDLLAAGYSPSRARLEEPAPAAAASAAPSGGAPADPAAMGALATAPSTADPAFGQSESAREGEIRTVLAKIKAEEERKERERERSRDVQRARRQVEEIAGRLSLTPDQTEKFAAFIVERDELQGHLFRKMRDSEAPREELRLAREKIQVSYDAKLQELLSPAQFAELQKIREEPRGGGPSEAGRGPGGRGQRGQ
jgi:hypothetical protein